MKNNELTEGSFIEPRASAGWGPPCRGQITIAPRSYRDEDYEAVCDFLIELNRKDRTHINWNWARFEWMMEHPEFDRDARNSIGLWWAGDGIIGAAIYDMYFGEAFCGALPEYEELYPEILGYAYRELKDDSGLAIGKTRQKSERPSLPDSGRPIRKKRSWRSPLTEISHHFFLRECSCGRWIRSRTGRHWNGCSGRALIMGMTGRRLSVRWIIFRMSEDISTKALAFLQQTLPGKRFRIAPSGFIRIRIMLT